MKRCSLRACLDASTDFYRLNFKGESVPVSQIQGQLPTPEECHGTNQKETTPNAQLTCYVQRSLSTDDGAKPIHRGKALVLSLVRVTSLLMDHLVKGKGAIFQHVPGMTKQATQRKMC